MTLDRDVLAQLREVWQGTRPRAPGVDLSDEPDELRGMVEELRGDWRALRAPRGGEAAFVAAVRERCGRRRRVRVFRAAALLVATAALGLLLADTDLNSVSAPAAATADPDRPRVLIATRDRVEMRSGPVHLVLVRPEPATEIEPTNPENER